jgi:dephospho-CoA kinase
MSNRWPGKYVIGLTGNIATGKSVVRKMLEHLGAFTIDADAFAHQAMAKGGPAYAAVIKTFGEWLLTPEGEINRAYLAKIVLASRWRWRSWKPSSIPSSGRRLTFSSNAQRLRWR